MATMWTFEDAQVLIQKLQPIVRPLGYHVALGGGVLNNRYSDKDLDLYFLPLDSQKTEDLPVLRAQLAVLLGEYLGEEYPLGFGTPGASYGPHPVYGTRATYIRGSQRTDVFII